MGLLDLLGGELREPAECIVRVGMAGDELADLYPFLSELTVDINREQAAVASMRFDSRRDENGVWAVQDAGILAPWEPIVIEAAFGSHTEEIMRGFIREVRADYPEEAGSASVRVECQDESLALDRDHVRTVWGAEAPTDDSTIVSAILARHGLAPHSDNGSGLTSLVLNQDATDIRFLRSRAQANGYELAFAAGEVYFGPLRFDAEPQPTILVYAGQDTHCFTFNVVTDGHKPDRVIFNVASETGAQSVEELVAPDLPLLGNDSADSSSAGLGDFAWRMERQGGGSAEELRARALRAANEQSLKIKAEGELDGSLYGHVLRVGEPVGVDGVGDWLQGTYYVDKVHHKFSTDGYRQRFTLLRNAYGDNLASAGNSLAAVLA